MEVLILRPDIALAVRGPFAVSSVAAKLTVQMIDDMMFATEEQRKRYGADAVSLTVMKPGVAIPEDKVRVYIAEVNKRPDSSHNSVVVIDAPGFWAATMRGILAGVALLSPHAPKGAGTVADGLVQIAPKLQRFPGFDDLASLEREIVALRDKHLALAASQSPSPSRPPAR